MSSLDSAPADLFDDEPAEQSVPPVAVVWPYHSSRWVNWGTLNLLPNAPVMLSPEAFASANRCQVIVHSFTKTDAFDKALDDFLALLVSGTNATLVLRSDDPVFPLDSVVEQLNRMHPELGMVYGGL